MGFNSGFKRLMLFHFICVKNSLLKYRIGIQSVSEVTVSLISYHVVHSVSHGILCVKSVGHNFKVSHRRHVLSVDLQCFIHIHHVMCIYAYDLPPYQTPHVWLQWISSSC